MISATICVVGPDRDGRFVGEVIDAGKVRRLRLDIADRGEALVWQTYPVETRERAHTLAYDWADENGYMVRES